MFLNVKLHTEAKPKHCTLCLTVEPVEEGGRRGREGEREGGRRERERTIKHVIRLPMIAGSLTVRVGGLMTG